MSSIWTIRRSTSDAKIAGVCGGIARHWNVDPVLVRVAFVLLALSGGIGLVLYAAGWLLVPADGKAKPVIHDLLGDQVDKLSREVWVAIVVIACVICVAALGGISPFGFGPALILALIWYFGYYRTKVRRSPAPPRAPGVPTPDPRGSQTQPGQAPGAAPPAVTPAAPTQFYSHPGPPTAFTQAADAWRERIMQVQQQGGSQPPTPSASAGPTAFAPGPQPWTSGVVEDRREPEGWAQPPAADDTQAFLAHPDPVGLYSVEPVAAPAATVVKAADRRSARRLRLVGLVALGLTLTALSIADATGFPVPAVAYLAATLLVIGLVLIAATWFGRARGILPVGIVLAIVTALATAVPQIPAPAQWQPRQIAYTSAAQFPAGGDRTDVGGMRIDLSQLALNEDATYAASVDLGALTVVVPPDVNVVVDYTVDAGSVTVPARPQIKGTELHAVIRPEKVDPSRPTLTLKLTADVGQIEVTS